MAVKEDETTSRDYRKRAELGRILVKEEVQTRIKLVTQVLRKDVLNRTSDEQGFLDQCPEVVEEVLKRLEKRATQKEREKELEDPPTVLKEKCLQLAKIIKDSKYVVVYTGAGISTAASIPDYRGPNGVWTLLQKGKSIGSCELSEAEPTITHMALAQLHRQRMISHVVSQNCDGLHLRSGLPRDAISEVHGNMLIEVCKGCKPVREYIRLFDVTEKTSLRKHKTGRQCYKCGHELVDTIVHFGEQGTLKSPLNWPKAIKAAEKCDLILCLGSSLKVLRKYTCLWGMDRPASERSQLCIVNLQWTPKDHLAALKINGRCDDIMARVMQHLEVKIPSYAKADDPLFQLATPLTPPELDTTMKKQLHTPKGDLRCQLQPQLAAREIKKCKVEKTATDFEVGPANVHSAIEMQSTAQEQSSSMSFPTSDPCGTRTCDIGFPSFCEADHIKTNQPTTWNNSESALAASCKRKSDVCKTPTSCSKDIQAKGEKDEEGKLESNEDESFEQVEDNEGCSSSASSNKPGWFGRGYKKLVKRKKRR